MAFYSETARMVEVAESAPNGDAVLIVGPGCFRFRVHSASLAMASEVFRDMFCDKWNVSASDPSEYMLPDDNPAGFRLIFDVIHFRNQHRVPAADDILEAAIIADKYRMHNALAYASEHWLKSRQACSANPKALVQLLAAAYLFQDYSAFEAISSDLILEYRHHYTDVIDNKIVNLHLPLQIVHGLEDRRTRLRLDLYQILTSAINNKGNCPCDQVKADALRALREKYDFSRIQRVSISEIITDVVQIVFEGHDPKFMFNTDQTMGVPFTSH